MVIAARKDNGARVCIGLGSPFARDLLKWTTSERAGGAHRMSKGTRKPPPAIRHKEPIMACKPVTEWVYVIQGFTQTRATRSRMVELWKELYDKHASPECLVELRQWNANWKAEAEHILRMTPDESGAQTTIKIFAYSWGAGWGFTQLAKALGSRGLRVSSAVLCDPVYRHSYRLGHWRTFITSWPIVIPPNVDEVYSFFQRMNWPCGHTLKAASDETTMHHPIELQADHSAMEDQPQFLARCRLVAQSLRIFPDLKDGHE